MARFRHRSTDGAEPTTGANPDDPAMGVLIRLGDRAVPSAVPPPTTLRRELTPAQHASSEIRTHVNYVCGNLDFIQESMGELLGALWVLQRAIADGLPPSELAALAADINPAELTFLREESTNALAESIEGMTRVVQIVEQLEAL